MTQLEHAKNNSLTREMRLVAQDEAQNASFVIKKIREGKIVLPHNKFRRIKKTCGIGAGLRTKINANIGTSTDKTSINYELKKLKAAMDYGADTVMDLSVGKSIKKMRRLILDKSYVPVGTVPVYEIAVNAYAKHGDFLKFGPKEILGTLESQAKDGVDFFTIHAGVTRECLASLKKDRRILGIVSRGGAMLASWITKNKKENPFYQDFDKILDIAYEYDVTLSLGDGLRPGSILDANDTAQISELKTLGELTQRARKRNVQVIIEGPGHVPINRIKENILLEKKICAQAPFYVLGPLVTDAAPGYDHITSAIGGALAASYGADFLCYVTPAEHLRHPTIEDVIEGTVASRVAAHAADIAKGLHSALELDRKISLARKSRDWKKQINLAIDPKKARIFKQSSAPKLRDVCTMCGKYCSIKLMEECLAESRQSK